MNHLFLILSHKYFYKNIPLYVILENISIIDINIFISRDKIRFDINFHDYDTMVCLE